jgi:hypothetical protein
MATTVILTINTNIGFMFSGNPFTALIFLDPDLLNSTNIPFTPTVGDTTATVGPILLNPLSTVTQGSNTFILSIPNSPLAFIPSPGSSVIVGVFKLTFDDTPQTITPNSLIIGNGSGGASGEVSVNINCLHGSSLIETQNGQRRLNQLKKGDKILSNNNEYAEIKGISYCWLSFLGVDHDAIIFEVNSLGLNQPSQKLIIDPGHPICTREEYLEKGVDALRPAGTYWEELKDQGQVLTKKWTDIFIQTEPSVRYDLILEEPYNTYIANGIVIRSKGYRDHRYKQLV